MCDLVTSTLLFPVGCLYTASFSPLWQKHKFPRKMGEIHILGYVLTIIYWHYKVFSSLQNHHTRWKRLRMWHLLVEVAFRNVKALCGRQPILVTRVLKPIICKLISIYGPWGRHLIVFVLFIETSPALKFVETELIIKTVGDLILFHKDYSQANAGYIYIMTWCKVKFRLKGENTDFCIDCWSYFSQEECTEPVPSSDASVLIRFLSCTLPLFPVSLLILDLGGHMLL